MTFTTFVDITKKKKERIKKKEKLDNNTYISFNVWNKL